MSVLRLEAALQLGGAEWLGVEPPGRPAEGGHVQLFERHAQTFEHGHLAARREQDANASAYPRGFRAPMSPKRIRHAMVRSACCAAITPPAGSTSAVV